MRSKLKNRIPKIAVKNSYTTIYDKPLILSKDEHVILGQKEDKEEWLGWIWASTEDNSGWIPVQIVSSKDGKNGIITEDYSAKELNVSEGESVIILKGLNGWSWVRNSETGEEGWVPDENLDF